MDGKYTFKKYVEDLDNGYKILFTYVRNRYVIYKVSENCYMQELVEQMSKNPVPPRSMITFKAIKMIFPYMENVEYKQG